MGYTYMVRCSDSSYYVGSTVDLERRIWEHNHSPTGPRYTKRRRPVVLVWSQQFDRIDEAFAFEKQVQGWGRRKREALMRGELNSLPALSRRKRVQLRESGEAT